MSHSPPPPSHRPARAHAPSSVRNDCSAWHAAHCQTLDSTQPGMPRVEGYLDGCDEGIDLANLASHADHADHINGFDRFGPDLDPRSPTGSATASAGSVGSAGCSSLVTTMEACSTHDRDSSRHGHHDHHNDDDSGEDDNNDNGNDNISLNFSPDQEWHTPPPTSPLEIKSGWPSSQLQHRSASNERDTGRHGSVTPRWYSPHSRASLVDYGDGESTEDNNDNNDEPPATQSPPYAPSPTQEWLPSPPRTPTPQPQPPPTTPMRTSGPQAQLQWEEQMMLDAQSVRSMSPPPSTLSSPTSPMSPPTRHAEVPRVRQCSRAAARQHPEHWNGFTRCRFEPASEQDDDIASSNERAFPRRNAITAHDNQPTYPINDHVWTHAWPHHSQTDSNNDQDWDCGHIPERHVVNPAGKRKAPNDGNANGMAKRRSTISSRRPRVPEGVNSFMLEKLMESLPKSLPLGTWDRVAQAMMDAERERLHGLGIRHADDAGMILEVDGRQLQSFWYGDLTDWVRRIAKH